MILQVIDGLNQEQLLEVVQNMPELSSAVEDIKSKKLIAKLIAGKKLVTAGGVYRLKN
jgi:hypothetical protein